MAVEFDNESGDFYGGGSSEWLKEPGIYHLIVDHATDMPLDKNGGQIVDAIFQIKLVVCNGPHKGKHFEQKWFRVRPDAKPEQKRIQAEQFQRLAYACNQFTNEDVIAKKGSFDETLMEGHQIIARLSSYERDGKSYLQFNYSDIWHIDDPNAPERDAVLNKEMVEALPANCRRKPEYFQALKEALKPAAGAASGNGAKSNGATKPATTKPATSLSDL